MFLSQPFFTSYRAFLILAGTMVLSGCAFKQQTTSMAMDHNEFVASTTNQQTVLNILRARDRQPMHFTSFTKVTGNLAGQVKAGLTTALNGNSAAGSTQNYGATNYTPNLGMQVDTSTLFDINIDADKEFYQGIMGPLDPGTLVYFLKQGFPEDLMNNLFISQMHFYIDLTPVQAQQPTGANPPSDYVSLFSVSNSPDDMADIDEFAKVIQCRRLDYELYNIEKGEKKGRKDFRLTLTKNPDPDNCQHIRSKIENSLMAALSNKNIPLKRSGNKNFKFDVVRNDSSSLNQSRSSKDKEEYISNTLTSPGNVTFTVEDYFQNFVPGSYKGDLVVDLTVRSVEGILYYLGEYARQSTPPVLVKGSGNPASVPIITIVREKDYDGDDPFVRVNYRKETYVVPMTGDNVTREAGRSSQVISFVQQLLNLNRSSKKGVGTPAVQIAN